MTAIGTKKENRWHLELKQRWVIQYNFYINDSEWGRMFVRICPYFPLLGARVPESTPLDRKSVEASRHPFPPIDPNAFSSCADPEVLQQIADSRYGQGPIAMRPKMACAADSILYRA